MKVIFWVLAAVATVSQPASAQERIDTPGTIFHSGARTGFPERVGAFSRLSAMRYDTAGGSNLSVSYERALPAGRVLVTVYIYPSPQVVDEPDGGESAQRARAAFCRNEFEDVQQAIREAYRSPRRLEEGGASAQPGVPAALSHRAVFRFRAQFDDSMQDVRSEARLYCYAGGEWQVKYRITAPAAADPSAAIEDFIREGPWPGRAVATIALR